MNLKAWSNGFAIVDSHCRDRDQQDVNRIKDFLHQHQDADVRIMSNFKKFHFKSVNSMKGVSCSVPRAPINGFIVSVTVAYVYEDVVEYGCKPGYVLVGVKVQTCNAEGEFTGAIPFCRGKVNSIYQ